MTYETIGEAPKMSNGTVVPLSPAIKIGELVYLSGQLPFDSSGSIPGTDIYTQTTQCLSNIQRVLADCNLEIKDVFKVTVWLKNVEDFGAFNKAYSEYFSSNFPARSVVRSELMIPNALVEIEVIASS